MARLGQISFQANDKTDVFHIAEVYEDGVTPSDENLLQIGDAQFEGNHAWVTGNVPRFKEVSIEGDNVYIRAWLKGDVFDREYTIRIYFEYEEAEELADVELESDENGDSGLEPQEIHL